MRDRARNFEKRISHLRYFQKLYMITEARRSYEMVLNSWPEHDYGRRNS